jgi:hypothetical protein
MNEEDAYLALDWHDLEHILRYFWVTPPEVTIDTLEELVGNLCLLARESGASPGLSDLEKTIDKTESGTLPLESILQLWEGCCELPHHNEAGRNEFRDLRLSVITRAFSRKFGRIEPADIVELAELAVRAANSMDVFESLNLSDLGGAISEQAMRALSLKDLRNTLERLVVLVQKGSLS